MRGAHTASRRRAVIEPLPPGVAPARQRPQTSGDLSVLATLLDIENAPTNTWLDTGIKPGNVWALRSMISGARDAQNWMLTNHPLTSQAGISEANANRTVPATDTLLNSNGMAWFPQAKQGFICGGGHGGWPGDEAYGAIDMQSRTWWRQTNPSSMARNADGTWRNLRNSPISRHTYGAIAAVESRGEFYIFGGSPWPLGGFLKDFWKFSIETNRWTLITENAFTNTSWANVPHLVWIEQIGKLALGIPRWWRTYDPATGVFGPIVTSPTPATHLTGMSIAADNEIYSFFAGTASIDRLAFSDIGVANPTNLILAANNQYPQWTSYADWSKIIYQWNSWLWDPVRKMAVCWTGGAGGSGPIAAADRGKQMWTLDFATGKLYELVLSGQHPVWDGCLGAFTKFVYLPEWDAYLCLNNKAVNNGWMVVKPGEMTLRAE